MTLLTWDMRGIIFHLTFFGEYFRYFQKNFFNVTLARLKTCRHGDFGQTYVSFLFAGLFWL